MNVQVSKHAQERFEERLGKSYRKEIKKIGVSAVIRGLIDSSKVNRTILNNSTFMQGYYDRYGYSSVAEFRVSDKVVFVCRGNLVVTVYDRRTSLFAGV